MSNAAYELGLEASGTLSSSNKTTFIDAFDDELQAQTKAMPFAMILGKSIAETELERAEWDLSEDEVSETLQDLEWVQRASQDTREIEATKELARKKVISRAWLISVCFSALTAFGALTAVNGLPDDIRTLGIQPVLAKATTMITVENAQVQDIKPATRVIVSKKHQGRLHPSEPLSTTPPTRVVEETAPTKVSDAIDTTQFKVSSRF